jgi:asparagine synthase (glutamine-hydrolysing)
VIQRMTDEMFHRGPDHEGFFESDDISLGMRRLSIIDLAGGKQAICNEDGSIVIVFNGTIYNALELSAWISTGTRKPYWII